MALMHDGKIMSPRRLSCTPLHSPQGAQKWPRNHRTCARRSAVPESRTPLASRCVHHPTVLRKPHRYETANNVRSRRRAGASPNACDALAGLINASQWICALKIGSPPLGLQPSFGRSTWSRGVALEKCGPWTHSLSLWHHCWATPKKLLACA